MLVPRHAILVSEPSESCSGSRSRPRGLWRRIGGSGVTASAEQSILQIQDTSKTGFGGVNAFQARPWRPMTMPRPRYPSVPHPTPSLILFRREPGHVSTALLPYGQAAPQKVPRGTSSWTPTATHGARTAKASNPSRHSRHASAPPGRRGRLPGLGHGYRLTPPYRPLGAPLAAKLRPILVETCGTLAGRRFWHRTSVEAGVSRTVGCRLPGCTPTPDRQRIATTEDALGGWPRLVIGVPTLGERSITGLLNELRRQAPEADIIVAFNGSSIGRSAVEAAVAESRSRLVESPRGYSYARNALLDAAKDADYLIYFDDDQIPDKGWFSAMVQVTSGLGPDVVLGPVLPILPTGAWASPYDLRHAADTDCGPFVGDGYSGNTAVRVHKVRAAGIHFAEEFARIGGEDTDFFRRLRAHGSSAWYCPGALALEYVDPERVTLRGRLRRGRNLGSRRAALDGRSPTTTAKRCARGLLGLWQFLMGLLVLNRALVGRGAFNIGVAWGHFVTGAAHASR